MTTIQERLQRKREPLDKWSIREQLCLSFAVAKVGDQNWMSVSRSLKPFGEGRPADWFHQKNCAAQYGALLENIDTPKRKKRSSGVEVLESPADLILKKLIQERMIEMKKLMEKEKAEYKKLQEEMNLLKSGVLTEEQLDQMCKEIDEEEALKEKEAIAHAQWLKEREIRKEEIERAWRPTIKMPMSIVQSGQKRKASDSVDSMLLGDNEGEARQTPETPTKPALSPLLTSLLKSPSHSQNVATSSILHSAITSNQRPVNPNTNPTIASLLNSSASVQVSPGIQQLVSTAIAQEPTHQTPKETITDMLDNANDFPNLVEDIESTILQVGDGDLPEIKNEEVDVIISDLIENADIVNDPETDLLDGDDIISNLESELEELDNKEKAEQAELEAEKQKQQQAQQQAKTVETKPAIKEPEIDPFEFQEDPEIEVKLSRSTSNSVQTVVTSTSTPSDVPMESPGMVSSEDTEEVTTEHFEEDSSSVGTEVAAEEAGKEEIDASEPENPETENGSVEIVEVVVMDDEDVSKELDKSQIQDIVHSSVSTSTSATAAVDVVADIKIKEEPVEINEAVDERDDDKDDDGKEEVTSDGSKTELVETSVEKSTSEESVTKSEVLSDNELTEDTPDPELIVKRDTFTPDFREDIYDENMDVIKIDKSKAKRDYSRTKKKDESDFDILLAVEQAVNANIEEDVDSSSEQEDAKKPAPINVKTENETSRSSWTEEEQEAEQEQEQDTRPVTRRYSTPATPIDSVPSSPASSYFEDDRDFRSWKKSLMLVYTRLSNHKYASLFQKPITNEQAPGYHKLVKRPIDLSTIKKNIESGAIRTTTEFKRDILLMFNNAIMYNKTNDTVYNMTMEIQQEAVEQIRILLQAQTDSAAPARRETRTSEGPGSKRKRDSESVQSQSKSKKRKED